MDVVPHEHGPVLGRVRRLVNLLGDEATQPRLLGKPLARGPRDGVPAESDGAGLAVDLDVAWRDHIGLLAETEIVLDGELRLEEVVLPMGCCFCVSQLFV